MEAKIAVPPQNAADLLDRCAHLGRFITAAILMPTVKDNFDGSRNRPGLPRQDAQTDSKLPGGCHQAEPVSNAQNLSGRRALNNVGAEQVLRLADGGDDTLDAFALDRLHERRSGYAVVILCRFLDIVGEFFGVVRASVIENAKAFFCVSVNIYYSNSLTSPSASPAFMDLGNDADF